MVKGIETGDRPQWGTILNRYHLNIRHAANELNWQVEDVCSEGLDLKLQLVRQFEEADLRTYQLCFAIKTQPKTGLQGSIIIKKDNELHYSISHTRDFNPNSRDEIVYAEQVTRGQLAGQLISLCHVFQDMQSSATIAEAVAETVTTQDETLVYECGCCLSRYDKTYGDPANSIPPGTDFESINDYRCPVCDAPKSEFNLIEVTQ